MRVIVLLMFSVLLSGLCSAQSKMVSRVSVKKHGKYAKLPEAMKELVTQEGKTDRNTFYACRVEQFNYGSHHAWIYWKEGNSIILAEPSAGYDAKYLLAWSRRKLNLANDVVPTVADIGGSNYLVTRKWARTTISDCVRRGDKFIVYKPTNMRPT